MRTRNPRQANREEKLDGGVLKAYIRPCVQPRGKLAGCRDFRNPLPSPNSLATTSPEAVHGSDAPTDVELWAAVLAEENAENSRIY